MVLETGRQFIIICRFLIGKTRQQYHSKAIADEWSKTLPNPICINIITKLQSKQHKYVCKSLNVMTHTHTHMNIHVYVF